MKETTSHLKNLIFRIETARKITQFLCFLLLNAIVFGFQPLPLLLPVLHSIWTPQKTVGDAFSVLQLMLYEVTFPWLPIAAFLLIAVVLNRATCGWVCPFGFIQDLLGYVKKKHSRVSSRTHKDMTKVKYGVLLIVLFVSGSLSIMLAAGTGQSFRRALGAFGSAPFDTLSPSNTIFATLPEIVLETRYAIPNWIETGADILGAIVNGIVSKSILFWIQLAIMIGVVVLGIYIPRSWCRYFCPHGAALAFLNRFSFLGLERDPVKCTKVGCRSCVEACPMNVPILELPWEKFTDPECIYCLKCVSACTTKAIRPQFP